jgi:hypothetical protein
MNSLFGDDAVSIDQILIDRHYLGASKRGIGYRDQFGVMVFANPSSRRLPQHRWVELVRWCITSEEKNSGSRQWKAVKAWLLAEFPDVTTVVSYSDPGHGHTGALYRACNWLWAPTWHRLREPPSGNGKWKKDTRQSVKDRWVFPLREDPERVSILSINDEGLRRRMPWAEFKEKTGGNYKQWRVDHPSGGTVVE